MFVAADGLPSFRAFALVVLAMVFARTAAMTFNRLADWEIDKRNPRTAGRHKLVSKPVAIGACVVSALLFVVTAWLINPLCFALSPVALAIVFFYSLTKRFTHGAQFFLGLALAVAPIGAWLAVTGSFALPPIALGASVLCWVAGIRYYLCDAGLGSRQARRLAFDGGCARTSASPCSGHFAARVRLGGVLIFWSACATWSHLFRWARPRRRGSRVRTFPGEQGHHRRNQ